MLDVSVRGLMFTDIEGSTSLLRQLGERYDAVLERHHLLIRSAVMGCSGVEQSREGDSMFITFPSASAAVAGAVAAQRLLESEPWPADGRVRVRIGLHVGEVAETAAGLVGLSIHQAARIMSACHGGQIVASSDVVEHAERMPAGVVARPIGRFKLRDIGTVSLHQVDHPELDSGFPPLRTKRAVVDNLPVPLTSLVGRSAEAAAVADLLDGHRLVTLLGAGGCGKSRLALRVSTDSLTHFVDGVWLVELAVLRPGMDIGHLVAQTVGVSGGLSEFVTAVRDFEMLLVLDNCEHVIESAAAFAHSVLASCPSIRMIATSRTPLDVAGEVLCHVPPLSVPRADANVDEVTASESAQLFVARASLVQTDFRLDTQTAAGIAEICVRLDGIPLAIELAAARLRGLSLAELVRRIDDRFTVLVGGPRSSPERQRTMRNTMDWTFDLLEPMQQLVLRQAAVFRGGCHLDALEATCSHTLASGRSVAEVVVELVDRALLVVGPAHSGGLRYGLHETVRDYLLETCESERQVEAERRHAMYFAELASDLRDGPGPGADVQWIRRHQDELENLRVAAEWLARDEPAAALRLLLDIEGGISLTMHDEWMHEMVRRVLPTADAAPTELRAAATAVIAWNALATENSTDVPLLCDRAMQLLGDSDDPIARCSVLSAVALCRADMTGAELDDRTVTDAVVASDRAGGTYWPIVTRYFFSLRSPPAGVESLTREALRIALHFDLQFFANALIRATSTIGAQFRAESAVVLEMWRDVVGRLDELGLYLDNNVCFYALAEGEHVAPSIGLHVAEDFLARVRSHRFDPSVEAALRWVAAYLSELEGDIERAIRHLDRADQISSPTHDFLGGLAAITRSAIARANGQPTVTIISPHLLGDRRPGLTDMATRLLEEFAAIADAQAHHRESADLLATAVAERRTRGTPLSPACRIRLEPIAARHADQQGTVLDQWSVRALIEPFARLND